MSILSDLLQKIIRGGGGLLWKKVFGKVLKGFLIGVATAAIMGLIAGLQAYVPEGTLGVAIWGAVGPAIIGALSGLLNLIKHWGDKPPSK